jgi:hypothetical protein
MLSKMTDKVVTPLSLLLIPEETKAWSNSNELSVGFVEPLVLEELP